MSTPSRDELLMLELSRIRSCLAAIDDQTTIARESVDRAISLLVDAATSSSSSSDSSRSSFSSASSQSSNSSSSSSDSSQSSSSSSQESGLPPASVSSWSAYPVPPHTPPFPDYPVRAELRGVNVFGPFSRIWVYAERGTKLETWWAWPDSGNMGKIKPVRNSDGTITLWCQNKTSRPCVRIGSEVEVDRVGGPKQVWDIRWDGQYAPYGWPVVGIGSIKCPVLAVMKHEGQPEVTTDYGHLVRGVIPNKDFENVTLDIGYLKENAPAGLLVRYTAGGWPITGWLDARACRIVVNIDSAWISVLPNGNHLLSFELKGEGEYSFYPMYGQLHLSRPDMSFLPSVPVYEAMLRVQDPANVPAVFGSGTLNPSDLRSIEHPVVIKPVAFTGVPNPRKIRVQCVGAPFATLFKPHYAFWSRRDPVFEVDTGYQSIWVPKQGESLDGFEPEFQHSNGECRHSAFPSRGGTTGPLGWVSAYSHYAEMSSGWGVSDTSGNVWHLGFDGKYTMLAGWQVMHDKFPIWPLAGKPTSKIREHMIRMGEGAMPTDGFGVLPDIAHSPTTPGFLVVPDYTKHCIWGIRFDPNNPQAKVTVSLIAGTPGVPGKLDGFAAMSLFKNPTSVTFSNDGAFIYVADRGNDAIRLINVSNKVVTTVKQSTMTTKYPKTVKPWDFRAAEPQLGASFEMMMIHWVRINQQGELVIADLGSGTVRVCTINGVSLTATRILYTGNFSMEKGGWMMLDVDRRPKEKGITLAVFTGACEKGLPTSGTQGALNENLIYIEDPSGNRTPLFSGFWDNDPNKARMLGAGSASQTYSPHYPWWASIGVNGIVANGAGTHATLIGTYSETIAYPTYTEYMLGLYVNGKDGCSPPQLTFGPMATFVPATITDDQIATKYPHWDRLTAQERTGLTSTIRWMHRR